MNINVSGEMDASGAVASPGSTVSAPFVLAFVRTRYSKFEIVSTLATHSLQASEAEQKKNPSHEVSESHPSVFYKCSHQSRKLWPLMAPSLPSAHRHHTSSSFFMCPQEQWHLLKAGIPTVTEELSTRSYSMSSAHPCFFAFHVVTAK